ncbi:MAG: AAA family ATPase [Candidatus Bathycorpusculaceae bacterium]
MKVIGVVGRIGSGKDTIVNYMSTKCSIPIFSIGDIAREIAKREGLPPTRKNLNQITERYYKRFGRTYFIDETVSRIKRSNSKKMLITGIRTPTDVAYLKKHFHEDFILISVSVNKRKRFQRLKARAEPRDPKTWREFLEQDLDEETIFHLSASLRLADHNIDNNGTLEELFRKVDEMIEEMNASN